ncbi:hypothetical protein F0562_000199 [Nyssa sinensis]|uniref:peroxidase n=1 Tax=Nyssa sinensis TaxID=561372 RepID=A0A5J5C101_9ASTE|nr:hypothetical protein F0562_000199 [Nyssa sinensis]
MWQVLTGRKDGRVSFASEAETDLPSSDANFTTLLSQFTSRGLDIIDLVTLSGAHTIGTGHCFMIANRIYNFTGNGDADPSLNPDYAKTLRTLCPISPNLTFTAEMDPQSSLSFDSHYFEALNQNKGFFQSDAALLTDTRSVQIVRILQVPSIFFARFGESMNRMGTIGVLTGGDGEIRKNCRVVNV